MRGRSRSRRRGQHRKLAAALLLCAAPLQAQVLDLSQAYELALTGDPTYQSASAANRAAQEAKPQARAELLPRIDADLTSTGNELDIRQTNSIAAGLGRRNFHSRDFNLTLTQPLFRKDRWIALDQARREVDQADAAFAFELQSLMVRVSERYFGVLRAADNLTFGLAEQEAFGQQLEQSQQRFEVGLIAVTDVEEAKAGFDLARAQVIQFTNELDNAREALREVTGEYHEAVSRLGAQILLEVPTPDDIDAWTGTALTQNLQLIGQRHAADTARLEIQRIEAGHLPTLDLVGSHRRSASNGGFSGGSDSTNSAIGVQAQLPIYAGGSVVSRTRQTRHLYQQSLDEMERVRRAVQRQTRNAFLGIQSGISRVEALAQAVKSNEAAVEAIEAGFQVGTRTSVDVLNAQRDLFGARRDFAGARYDYILDILALKQAAGTLSEDDLRLINTWLE